MVLVKIVPDFEKRIPSFPWLCVRSEPFLRGSVFALFPVALAMMVWFWIERRFFSVLAWLVRRRVMLCEEGVPLLWSRPNCWPWRELHELRSLRHKHCRIRSERVIDKMLEAVNEQLRQAIEDGWDREKYLETARVRLLEIIGD
jgi:hypothetical protein